jgi:hypothetical protein
VNNVINGRVSLPRPLEQPPARGGFRVVELRTFNESRMDEPFVIGAAKIREHLQRFDVDADTSQALPGGVGLTFERFARQPCEIGDKRMRMTA